MTLFTTLLVLIFERLFKLGEHWQLDHRLEAFFRRGETFFSRAHVRHDHYCDGA
ncbi:AmpE protein [Escherichia coli]|nr:AmpE protein [Escherichia coli]